MSQSTALVARVGPVLQPASFAELMIFADKAANSTLVPKDYQGKPENIMLAVQMGSELGMPPMQAIQSIAVIGGRPSVWGDAMLALVRQSPLCESVVESFEGDGEELTAVCVARRRGEVPIKRTFNVADAKRARLWTKPGPWQEYPKRMLAARARGFALRDAFPDVLRGMILREEAQDYPVINGRAEPPRPPEPIRQVEPPPEPQPPEPPPPSEPPLPPPAAANDGVRQEWSQPDYPIRLPDGSARVLHSGTEYLLEWRHGLERMGDQRSLIRRVRDDNRAALATVAGFDPQAAAEVEEMLNAALKEPGV